MDQLRSHLSLMQDGARRHAMKKATPVSHLLSLLRAYRWGFPAIVGLGILQSLSEGIGIGLFIPLLTGLVTDAPPQASGQWFVDTMDGLFRGVAPERRLAMIILCVFAAVAATALLHYLHTIVYAWLDGHVGHEL